MRDELRIRRILQAEELDVERRSSVVCAWAGVNLRAATEIHRDQQLCARPDAEFTRSDSDWLAGRVQGRGNLAHYRRVGRVADVEDQDAGLHVRACIQAKVGVSSTRVTETATTGTVGAVTDINKVLKNRFGGRSCHD